MKLIECVPNFSEGRDLAVVHAIRDRIAAVEGVSILHVTADASHNRSVITFVAPMHTMVDAAFAAIRAARDLIDLRQHAGVHPRIGAADVVPFVPLEGATMMDCIAIANELGERVGTELDIPVYLYERAATTPSRRNLANIRRGGFEGLRTAIASDPSRAPDFGPLHMHPSFGAVAIGARPFLIAFNVYIGPADRLAIARDIARAIRESSGGLPCVKALALEVDGQAQVSMNLVDIEVTSLATAFHAVEREAQARGVAITWSEVIGLVPESAAFDVATHQLRLREPLADHVLERHLLARRTNEQSMSAYIDALGSGDAPPGGGSAAAIAGALAAALTRMVATLTLGRERYAHREDEMRDIASEAATIAHELHTLAQHDTEAYAAVIDARLLPATTPAESARRSNAISNALIEAARVPLDVARLAARVVSLTAIVARHGNENAITDTGVAALMASAACTGAAYNVRVNVKSLQDVAGARDLGEAALTLARSTELVAREVAALVNDTL